MRTNSVNEAADHLLAVFVDSQQETVIHDVTLRKELTIGFDCLLQNDLRMRLHEDQGTLLAYVDRGEPTL